ncbi:hypothetical protein MTP04_05730 [Lysinibacillus sp. PLM2]|nr:hypothetical protein MTP04_05730 [Lysinibacillus sp. PLM2]
MIKVNIGLFLLLISAIIYGSILIAASIYSQVLVKGNIGWDTRYGVFGTSFREIGTIPLSISILLTLSGVVIIVLSIRKKI